MDAVSFIDQRQQYLAGWLKKKSPKGLLKAWQRRYFVLYEDLLYYFKDIPNLERGPDFANPTGTIPLQCMEMVKVIDKKPKGCRFDVKVNGRTFQLCAPNTDDCNKWVKAIQELVVGMTTRKSQGMEIDTSGKFWKNTEAVREARARSITWGDRRYLMSEEEVEEDDSTVNLTSTEKVENTINGLFEEDSKRTPFELVDKLMSHDEYFGDVYSCRDTKTKVIYIMHVISNDKNPQRLFDEMSLIRHPYIFQQVHRGECTDVSFAIYTYALEESLFVHLRAQRRFPEAVVVLFGAELVSALQYLHEQSIVFKHLRAENIFLDAQGHIVISDLLLSATKSVTESNNIDNDILKSVLDEPAEYQTPEFLKNGQNDNISDWWRLGVLLYELLVGIPPFRIRKGEDANALSSKIANHVKDKLKFPPFVSDNAKDCIRRLLDPNPETRLGKNGLEEVQAHPFFSSLNWNDLQHRAIVSPDYVDEHLQHGRQARNRINRFIDPTKTYEIVLQLDSARGLPGLQPNGKLSDPYCIIHFNNDNVLKSEVIKNTVKPKWDAIFNSEFKSIDNDITIEVYHNDAESSHSSDPVIGTVTLSMESIFYDRLVDQWLPIVGRDAIGHGELKLKVMCCERVERVQIEPATLSTQSFSELFLAKQNRPSLAL